MIPRLLSAVLALGIFGSSLLWDQLRSNPGHWPIFAPGENGVINSEIRTGVVVPPAQIEKKFGELRVLAATRREFRGTFEWAGSVGFGAIVAVLGFGASLLFGGGIWWLD